MMLRLNDHDINFRLLSDKFEIRGADGSLLWRGDGAEFSALMSGLRWEELCINSHEPTHRRLVSRAFPIGDE